jgi:hypothetical protein
MRHFSPIKGNWLPDILIALMMLAGVGTLYAQNPSDVPRGPGPQLSAPPTGGALTPTPFEPAEHVFNRLDTQRTGFLTRDQVALLERFPFEAADLDHDGRLNIAEFSKVWGAYNNAK